MAPRPSKNRNASPSGPRYDSSASAGNPLETAFTAAGGRLAASLDTPGRTWGYGFYEGNEIAWDWTHVWITNARARYDAHPTTPEEWKTFFAEHPQAKP